ncbi:MAG: VIT1/CCC1 transporter family protein, partial [Candidatus Aenigmarchaeota archaeon]|nr:VIT1/CCC1 transporter family protein [Candidatus Aenigmarchaeota archaeon]
ATQDPRMVIIAGLAATFAESVSMAAVAYTSSKAYRDYYRSELEREKREIKEVPKMEEKEIHNIYYKKGFRGRILDIIVKKITSSKKMWLSIMMKEELNLTEDKSSSPVKDAGIVGGSAIVGSVIPLVPFFLFNVGTGIIASLIFSVVVLFITGAVKNRITIGHPLRGAVEMAIIGMGAALIGYGIGAILGVALHL